MFRSTVKSSVEAANELAPVTMPTKRRGYWKKIRVRPVDTFETAESQHVSANFFNVLLPDEKQSYQKDVRDIAIKKVEKNILNEINQYPDEDNEKPSVLNAFDNKISRKLHLNPIKESTEILKWNRDSVPQIVNLRLDKDVHIRNINSEEKGGEVPTTPLPNNLLDGSNVFDGEKSLTELFIEDTTDRETEFDVNVTTPVEREMNIDISTTAIYDASAEFIRNDTMSDEDPSNKLLQTSTSYEASIPTSTSKQISRDTEICFRGKCVKTDR